MGASCAYVIYDTFSFKLTLPPNSRNLEFCVCYRADGKEYWDNNQVSICRRHQFNQVQSFLTTFFRFFPLSQGVNYKLTNRVSARQEENEFFVSFNRNEIKPSTENCDQTENNKSATEGVDIPKPRLGSWSEFSTRNETILPYW